MPLSASAAEAIVTSCTCTPRAGLLLPPLLLPFVHCCHPLSSAVAASLLLLLSAAVALNLADCQVVAPCGLHHILSDESARSIDARVAFSQSINARGPFLAAAAMVVLVVRFFGASTNFVLWQARGKNAVETKIARLITRASQEIAPPRNSESFLWLDIKYNTIP